MDTLTFDQLWQICPQTPAGVLAGFVEPLIEACAEFDVGTPARRQMFLAQYAHETQGFTRLEENLRYTTVEALLAATRPRWDALDRDDAWGYLNQPERLGNRVYANRGGNGDEASGDGWRYRGRGLPHLTFLGNYQRCGEGLRLPLLDDPDLLLQPLHAARAGGWYWRTEMCNRFADKGDFHGLTVAINGGLNGYELRKDLLARAQKAVP